MAESYSTCEGYGAEENVGSPPGISWTTDFRRRWGARCLPFRLSVIQAHPSLQRDPSCSSDSQWRSSSLLGNAEVWTLWTLPYTMPCGGSSSTLPCGYPYSVLPCGDTPGTLPCGYSSSILPCGNLNRTLPYGLPSSILPSGDSSSTLPCRYPSSILPCGDSSSNLPCGSSYSILTCGTCQNTALRNYEILTPHCGTLIIF